ncbi:hypothetical protein L484_026085 [Morus notabilis]|uniref:Uncharacterized protein n=1 Tax=Morus notabilis TaxID=981085 RepID=W9RG56_9ROSA|nr:hypothetical protein L484_026085 [Morus notabilis]
MKPPHSSPLSICSGEEAPPSSMASGAANRNGIGHRGGVKLDRPALNLGTLSFKSRLPPSPHSSGSTDYQLRGRRKLPTRLDREAQRLENENMKMKTSFNRFQKV